MPTSKKKTDQNIKAAFICDCDEDFRSACEGFGFYKEKDGKRYCVLHYPDKDKSEDFKKALQQKLDAKDFNFSGVWFPDELNLRNFEATSTIYFNSAIFNADVYFNSAIFRNEVFFVASHFKSFVDFNSARFDSPAYFRGSIFSVNSDFSSINFNFETYFTQVEFIGKPTFRNTQFKKIAEFNLVLFNSDAIFNSATFKLNAQFNNAEFKRKIEFKNTVFNAEIDFSSTTFKSVADFEAAIFDSEVNFKYASFMEKAFVDFSKARLKEKFTFEKNTFAVDFPLGLDDAIFEKPDRVTFHSVTLRPHWFVNVESRKFNFVDVNWCNQNDDIQSEIDSLKKRITNPYQLLAVAARQLAVNAEENNRYSEAANFRYMAMKVYSIEIRPKILKGFFSKVYSIWCFIKELLPHFLKRFWASLRNHFDPLHSLYGISSGWGESILRACAVLILIWILFAGIYWWRSDASWWQKPKSEQTQTAPQTLSFPEAMVYSAGVMLFQKPEPLPANKRARFLVYLETVLGPLQAALLALAIRRKFMR